MHSRAANRAVSLHFLSPICDEADGGRRGVDFSLLGTSFTFYDLGKKENIDPCLYYFIHSLLLKWIKLQSLQDSLIVMI